MKETDMSNESEKENEQAASSGLDGPPCSPMIWMQCDLRSTFFHWLISTPVVIVTLWVSFRVPDVWGWFGFILGVWLMGLHNIVWALISKKHLKANSQIKE